MADDGEELNNLIIHKKYTTIRKIGNGRFGKVYLAENANHEPFAIKFEAGNEEQLQLRHEFKVYKEMKGCTGFADGYHYGSIDSHNYMVMGLLGPSLETLFVKCYRRFSLKT
eukprot:gene10974-22931_t